MINNTQEQQYLDLLREIRDHGTTKRDRTGVGTLYLFGRSMRFRITDSIPVLTTKKMFWKGIVEELLLFLSGKTDTTILENNGVKIWSGNTRRAYLDKLGLTNLPEGDMGCSYSHQWRNFGGEHPLIPETKGLKGFDQIKYIVDTLKSNPADRRLVLNAWSANQLQYMALPPCHMVYVFSVDLEKKELNCHMTQRSCDFFLGIAYNLASMALLTTLMAKVSNLTPGEIFWTGTDCHLYLNHLDAVEEQLAREPYPFPKLEIAKPLTSLDDILSLKSSDIQLRDYQYHPAIKAEMAV